MRNCCVCVCVCSVLLLLSLSLYDLDVVCRVESHPAVLPTLAPALLILVLQFLEDVTCVRSKEEKKKKKTMLSDNCCVRANLSGDDPPKRRMEWPFIVPKEA